MSNEALPRYAPVPDVPTPPKGTVLSDACMKESLSVARPT